MRMTSQCQALMLSTPVANAHRFRRHRLDVRRNVDYCLSYIRDRWSRRCKSLDGRGSDEFDHRSWCCVGHGGCWSYVFNHRSQRFVGLDGRWKDSHESRLNILHHQRRHIDNGWSREPEEQI